METLLQFIKPQLSAMLSAAVQVVEKTEAEVHVTMRQTEVLPTPR